MAASSHCSTAGSGASYGEYHDDSPASYTQSSGPIYRPGGMNTYFELCSGQDRTPLEPTLYIAGK